MTSFLSSHLTNFNDFKSKVLSTLDAWHLKCTNLSQLATKYMDTLEEYKMMFVQMKQLLREKDAIVNKTRTQMADVREAASAHFQEMAHGFELGAREVMLGVRDILDSKEAVVKEKEGNVKSLVEFQHKQRAELVRTNEVKDDLEREGKYLKEQNEKLMNEVQVLNKS